MARARRCEFKVRQLPELKQHTPNAGGVQSHAAASHVQQVEHVAKEPMNRAHPKHCKHHLLLHNHSTKPMRQTTTQSGCKRNTQEAAPRKHCTCGGVVDGGAKAHSDTSVARTSCPMPALRRPGGVAETQRERRACALSTRQSEVFNRACRTLQEADPGRLCHRVLS